MRVDFDSLPTSGKRALKRAVKSAPILSGICMPAMRILISEFLERALVMIPSRFFLVSSGDVPRKPSLPPRAMTRTSAPFAMAQPIRRRPPAVVSPLMPALVTV